MKSMRHFYFHIITNRAEYWSSDAVACSKRSGVYSAGIFIRNILAEETKQKIGMQVYTKHCEKSDTKYFSKISETFSVIHLTYEILWTASVLPLPPKTTRVSKIVLLCFSLIKGYFPECFSKSNEHIFAWTCKTGVMVTGIRKQFDIFVYTSYNDWKLYGNYFGQSIFECQKR